jgi:hypothetical protein
MQEGLLWHRNAEERCQPLVSLPRHNVEYQQVIVSTREIIGHPFHMAAVNAERGEIPSQVQPTSTPLPQRHRLRDRLSKQDLSTLVESFPTGTPAHVLAEQQRLKKIYELRSSLKPDRIL